MSEAPRDRAWWILVVFTVLNLANGIWMLADPKLWYTDLPAAVPDFGPYNEHFVRDLGFVFLTLAGALWWAAQRPEFRVPMVAVTTAFYVLHAAGHVFDTARGFVDASHWWVDMPGVYIPAVFLVGFMAWLMRQARPARLQPRRI